MTTFDFYNSCCAIPAGLLTIVLTYFLYNSAQSLAPDQLLCAVRDWINAGGIYRAAKQLLFGSPPWWLYSTHVRASGGGPYRL